jgi:hypothetical protein
MLHQITIQLQRRLRRLRRRLRRLRRRLRLIILLRLLC